MEMFHNFWNSDPISGPVPLFGELLHIFGTLFHKLWNCSTFCRTVPQIVALFHFLQKCSIKSGTVPLCIGLLGYCRAFISMFNKVTSMFTKISCKTLSSQVPRFLGFQVPRFLGFQVPRFLGGSSASRQLGQSSCQFEICLYILSQYQRALLRPSLVTPTAGIQTKIKVLRSFRCQG